MTAPRPVHVPHRRDVAHESFDDEVILIHFPSGKYFRLDAPGRVAWAAIEGGATAEDVAATFARAFDVGAAEALDAAQGFLAELTAHGLVLVDPAAEARRPAGAGGPDGGPAAPRAPFQRPRVEVFTDLEQLFLVDPIHDVDATGWPHAKP
ncbi:MAG: PqqD family protein [Planctomycetota bacterium]